MSVAGGVPLAVLRYARELDTVLRDWRPDVVGVYLHGSTVLGGFQDESSDVDLLVVVTEAGTAESQQRMGDRLVAAACPGTGLEMSVVTAATAADLGDCPFEVHVATSHGRETVVPGAGHPGDPDLVLHTAVCREHGYAVTGPPALDIFAALPRGRILGAMVRELRWALDEGLAGYGVLNACRALRYTVEGRLCSKVDGGNWYLARHPDHPVVSAVLREHLSGDQSPLTETSARFVQDIGSRLASGACRTTPGPKRASGATRRA